MANTSFSTFFSRNSLPFARFFFNTSSTYDWQRNEKCTCRQKNKPLRSTLWQFYFNTSVTKKSLVRERKTLQEGEQEVPFSLIRQWREERQKASGYPYILAFRANAELGRGISTIQNLFLRFLSTKRRKNLNAMREEGWEQWLFSRNPSNTAPKNLNA